MKKSNLMRAAALGCALLMLAGGLCACGGSSASGSSDKVVIYANSDDEAIQAMKETLDENGYKGQYTFQTFGTTELGGKMLAEGKNLEADMVCMSTFYIDSAQESQDMFVDIKDKKATLDETESYYSPLLAFHGCLFYNTDEIKKEGLTVPTSIKDLANPEYEGHISVPDISGSSTAWLMIQALIGAYGEDEAKTILTGIYKNAGDNLESSGSGPIKKVLAGEVAIGFGLRHQAIADKNDGKPIDYVDPSEGDYTLTESMAVLNHDDQDKVDLATEMVNCIADKGREKLMEYYPIALYEGETTDTSLEAPNAKVFDEPLTVDLLKKHTELSESCK